MKKIIIAFLLCFLGETGMAQDYFLEKYQPFDENIPSPEAFLGYGIGEQHTRHDMIVAYLRLLAERSDRAEIEEYGKTYEGRPLLILRVSSPQNLNRIDALRDTHLQIKNGEASPSAEQPVFINLGYNVHGNEPSSSEAALLAAYTLVASENSSVANYREHAVVFIDPTINPDGRDRHTHWANSFKGDPLVDDPQDIEHNEAWPGGRTNHYWFDLNRDWLLAVHPESRGKLNWYHHWYPNVVTDFHEMGTESTYFFEPMKAIGSKDPIMPAENYEDLNELFGTYFASSLDSIGSLYFTGEVFDGTYPGYGSSYPDLQGGLGLLFEQASSRGHLQKTEMGEISFPFTIRNQFVSSMTTVKASVENREYLQDYLRRFFDSAIENARKSDINAYRFTVDNDRNRLKAFLDKLLIHRIDVYREDDGSYLVPTAQEQYRMVQTVFETYDEYRDSVYYDASAWSLANFYNVNYKPVSGRIRPENKITEEDIMIESPQVQPASYAYLGDWRDYNGAAFLHYLQEKKVRVQAAFKPFTTAVNGETTTFPAGTLVVPVSKQDMSEDALYDVIKSGVERFGVPVSSVGTGYHQGAGIDLGSRYVETIKPPKPFMLVGEGVRSYEAGEVWHLLDQRVHMPITKIPMRDFSRSEIEKYNTMVMVSGRYNNLDSTDRNRIKNWVSEGNTLIAIGDAVSWLIENDMIKEELIEEEKDTVIPVRKPYIDAPEYLGREEVGGAIFEVNLDLTHPVAFGYTEPELPVYKNNSVWLAPSKNAFSTIAKYTDDPHIDGYITEKNLNNYLKPAASVVASKLGSGRVLLFADNPNFRGAWYGTNKMFFNALFFGSQVRIPD
ncbi:M14 family zinc carboxypeptidase [Robertkochia aurantiaca]|uniref:M14 family zinc carboxypeptidase n=1 Tax=Robertkochia aurantiaca TaxID=2873700 RepID=UPI001CCC179A|nr:M14 family zinc carboxypeptidase [Robertkochia sp. 3YJGBD-33]